MQMHINKRVNRNMTLTAVAAAVSLLAACGGGGGGSSGSTAVVPLAPVVADSVFIPGSATDPTFSPTAYQNAMVCIDANDNGKCDVSENPVRTDSHGSFVMPAAFAGSALIADIGKDAIDTKTGKAVASRTVFRISADQVTEQGNKVVISPISAEIVRMMEEDNADYATEKQNLATRMGVPVTAVTGNAGAMSGATQKALLSETYALSERYTYATKKLDRGDLYPDALAVAGGDPELQSFAAPLVTAATNTTAETRTPITFKQSQQAAFNIEGVPRYDNIFIVMLENKATLSIKNSSFAPNINHYLQTGNQLTSYFATGNPSEPNYTALGGADDFGIADDSQWNCDATGTNAVQDTPVPDKNQPGLAKSPFTTTCTQASGVNHNIIGKPNLFTAIAKAGLNWRTYSESMNPGQDFRTDSVADAAVTAPDHVYPVGSIGGNTAVIGDSNLTLPLPAGLYKTKHHPGMAYQEVRSAPEWKYSNRTIGGGQWDTALLSKTTAYKIPAGYNLDQFSSDLQSGNVGNLNFVMPDQCDDMHSIIVSGVGGVGTASDCSSVVTPNAPPPEDPANRIITRGDNYVKFIVDKIQQSPLWTNPKKRVAIVLMFDEGNASSGFNSCCGWNPANSTVANPLKQNADGTFSADTSVHNYTVGNRGHGESIFAILTNTPSTKGVSDSDAYSHFSFVRTLQDMFALADPADDSTYMNRSKYTEKFIAENILNLPEFNSSIDTHFDSVRPINHAFVAPLTYTEKQSADVNTAAQVGPDTKQDNVWAVK